MRTFRSLRGRLLAAFVGVALVPLAILAVFSLVSSEKNLEKVQRQGLLHQCTLAALEFEKAFAEAESDLVRLSQLPSLRSLIRPIEEIGTGEVGADGAILATELASAIRPVRRYASIVYVDQFGDEVAKAIRTRNGIEIVPPEELRNVSQEPFFQESMRLLFGGDIGGGDFEPRDTRDLSSGAVIRILTRLFDDSYRRRGVLLLQLDVELLLKEIRGQGVSAETLLIIDSRGAYIEDPPRASAAGLPPWHLDLAEKHPEVFEAFDHQGPTVRSSPNAVGASRPVQMLASTALPLTERTWRVATIRPLAALRAPTLAARRLWLTALLSALALALGLGLMISSRVSRPIQALAKEASELGHGRFETTLQIRTGDELEELSRAMTRMAEELGSLYKGLEDRIDAKTGELKKANDDLQSAYDELRVTHELLKESEAELIQSEKLSSIGRLAASVAHEINNPAGIVSMYAQMMREETDDAAHQQMLDTIMESAEKISSTVKSLLDFSRRAPNEPVRVDIVGPIRAAIDDVAVANPETSVVVSCEVPDGLVVSGDRVQLGQVFRNLLENASQAMDSGGTIQILGELVDREVVVTVTDTGPGVDREQAHRIFEPFFTTKTGSKGTGLGLAVSYGIVKSHRGSIQLDADYLEGARFVIRLPAEDGP